MRFEVFFVKPSEVWKIDIFRVGMDNQEVAKVRRDQYDSMGHVECPDGSIRSLWRSLHTVPGATENALGPEAREVQIGDIVVDVLGNMFMFIIGDTEWVRAEWE
jgi:hypothetical protein